MLSVVLATFVCIPASGSYDFFNWSDMPPIDCKCNNVGERNGAWTCKKGGETGSCESGEYCISNDLNTAEDLCKPACVSEWEGSPPDGSWRTNCKDAPFPLICGERDPRMLHIRDSNGKNALQGCPQCRECYATCDNFDCGNAGSRTDPVLCDGPCEFSDCCNYHFNFACDQSNVPANEDPKWFNDMFLTDGQHGLVLETESGDSSDKDRSIKYVVDSNLDPSLKDKKFVIIEDCESTIGQSWRIFGFRISDGERIEITDRFGYGNPINNNGGISNQRDVHPGLRLKGGDCKSYQFVNLARIRPADHATGPGWTDTTFQEFSRVEIEASMTSRRDVFRGLLKVHLRCEVPELSGEATANIVCRSNDDCEADAGMYCNLDHAGDDPIGLCEEQSENKLRCNDGEPHMFSTRARDDSGASATCHDWNSIDFTDKEVISFPCVKIEVPDFNRLLPWDKFTMRATPNPLANSHDEAPNWDEFNGWQIHMCGTEGNNDQVGFGLLLRDADYAIENILHIRELNIEEVDPANLEKGDGISVQGCRDLNPNTDSITHSPGFSWKSFGDRSIQKRKFEIWVYQYPLDKNCEPNNNQGVSCENGKKSIITSADSPLYMSQTIKMTFKCDKKLRNRRPLPPPSMSFLTEASHELRNKWWEKFLNYIRTRRDIKGVDVSYQIVNTVRGAFHDMIMQTDSTPMGCLGALGQDDIASTPFQHLRDNVDLEQVTKDHTNKILSAADESVILGAMAIDWTTLQLQDGYDWNENDNLLHKIRVGRPGVNTQECWDNQKDLESKLPQRIVTIDGEDGTRTADHDEPLFKTDELSNIRAGVQSPKGRMTAAHEEFKRAMLVGDLDMRDAVALMGGHGLGFIRIMANWAPLDPEDDCNGLRGGPWTTQPHLLDNEYFTILLDLLEVAEQRMDLWTQIAPAEQIWEARDAVNWIMFCGENSPKVPVDTAQRSEGDSVQFSSIAPTENKDDLFLSNLMLLDSDLALIFSDDTLPFVREFAAREITFLDAFHKAYIKLSERTDAVLKSYTHPNGVPGDLLERNPSPTRQPTATDPSVAPSRTPSLTPSTKEPTYRPTASTEPTREPTTGEPSFDPSSSIPSNLPSPRPSSIVPPYPYSVSRWAQFGSQASCWFGWQGYNYRISSRDGFTMASCKSSCEADSRCLSILFRHRYTTCIMYNKIPTSTNSYTHGGQFTCLSYDGGKGARPLYHWRGWGDCYTSSGSAIAFTIAYGTNDFQSCLQRCRNENCLSVTWRYGTNVCRLHRQYAATSQNGYQSHKTYAQCYNVLYN